MASSKKIKKDKSKGPDPVVLGNFKEIHSLILLAEVFEDSLGWIFHRFLKGLAQEKFEEAKSFKRYGKLWRAAGAAVEKKSDSSAAGSTLQNHWLDLFLENGNPFHRKAETKVFSKITTSLKKAYQRELGIFRRILRMDWELEFKKRAGSSGYSVPSLAEEEDFPEPLSAVQKARREIKEKILSNDLSDAQLASEISRHFYQNGWGFFGSYRAFRWNPEGRKLEGIDSIDPIRLENLVGYDEARRALLEGVEAFASGKIANNVLIYGERGTGKSSTVKALLNAHAEKGLRLVEVHPDDLKDYLEILKPLRGRKERFILFVDDLSFEENETSYKGLKALLEGSVEATPGNVILIATSNRRHLVREFFQDRSEGVRQDGEVHGQDTVEEKLSLSDRFGLVVSFYSPDQGTYLSIIENWARVEGLKTPVLELKTQALRWALANNGRSGRARANL